MRRIGCVITAAAALLAASGCGGGEDSPSKGEDPFQAVSRQPRLTQTARNAAPRWEFVARYAGTAPSTHKLSISSRAIQWRARWSCTSGRIALSVEPAPRSLPERPGGGCRAKHGEVTWVQTGSQRLRVEASARWSVIVEQQVDTPLVEPPLAAMSVAGAKLLERGSFYSVERSGRGTVKLYRLPGGRGALRLDPFRTSTNTDLFIWLSTARRPRSTKATVQAPRVGELIALKSTEGSQNYLLPKGLRLDRIRSIAIWCAPIQIIYTAAALRA